MVHEVNKIDLSWNEIHLITPPKNLKTYSINKFHKINKFCYTRMRLSTFATSTSICHTWFSKKWKIEIWTAAKKYLQYIYVHKKKYCSFVKFRSMNVCYIVYVEIVKEDLWAIMKGVKSNFDVRLLTKT